MNARRPRNSRSSLGAMTIHSIPSAAARRAQFPERATVKTVSSTPAPPRLVRRWKLYDRSPASGNIGSTRVSQRHRSRSPRTGVLSGIDAQVINCQCGGEIRGVLRRPGPAAADRQVDDELRRSGRRSIGVYPGKRAVCHEAVIDEMPDRVGCPFNRKLMEIVREVKLGIESAMAIEREVTGVTNLPMED